MNFLPVHAVASNSTACEGSTAKLPLMDLAEATQPPVTAFVRSHALRFIRAHRGLIAWFVVTSTVRVGTTVASVVLIRDFLGSILSTPSGIGARLTAAVGASNALLLVAALLFVVFLTSALAAYGSQVAMQQLSRRIELDLMETLIGHLLRLPVAFFDQRRRGDLIESVRNDVTKARAVTASIVELAVFAAQSAAAMAAALWLSPRLLLISMPVLLLGAMPTRWLVGQMRRRSWHTRQFGYRLTDLLLQLAQGIRIVKIYAGEDLEARNSIATARRYFEQLLSSTRIKAVGDVALEAAASLSVVAVIVAGGFEVMAGRLSMPSLVAVLIAIRAIHGPLNNAFGRLMESQANWSSLERIQALLAIRPDISDRPGAVALDTPIASVRFDRVSFAYDGKTPVLADVSFEARMGQHIGIVGPSGSGKTTLVSLLARFYDPAAGRILLNDRDLRDYRLRDVHQQLALVTQDLFVFGTTVRDNIRYGRLDASDADVERAAAAAEIHDDILMLPDQYATVLGVGGRLLSAGQIQRINVARALLKDASIVILDEATSNLDSISEMRIQTALSRLMAGKMTFTIAHRLSTLRRADLILVVDRGTVVASGSHDVLLGANPLYRELWATQHAAAGEAMR
jgi:subfamily B ATP-binding cassette protein MsbA